MVSVVIPTRNRPELLCRAVSSALVQTCQEIEVIVVVDGPDNASVTALEQIDDSRLTLVVLPANAGPSVARNAGVQAAKGEWIAFLDDDDEWLPLKLEKQLNAVHRVAAPFPIMACYVIVRTPAGDVVRQNRVPEMAEPLSEYLFSRRSFFQTQGLLQTSTLLLRKELLAKVPFRSGLHRHEDWDMLLRASRLDGVSCHVVPEPLSIWYTGEARTSLSADRFWKPSLEWLRESSNLFTPRAYAGFVVTQVVPQAAKQGEWKAFLPLLREMYRNGAPRVMDFWLYIVMWMIPQEMRRSLSALLARGRSLLSRTPAAKGRRDCQEGIQSDKGGSREDITTV